MVNNEINRNKKAVFGWTMYDWANSVYALAITTAIFPTYFSQISKNPEVMVRMDNNLSIVRFMGLEIPSVSLYSYAISFAYVMIVLLSPLLGGIADYSGSKKKFMMAFCGLGSVSCSFLYFFDQHLYSIGIYLFVLAAIGYAGGNIFNDAFLPEVSAPEDYAKISARGFMMGYIGSMIQLVISLVLVMKYQIFGFASALDATKVSFILVGIWWFGFAQFTFFALKDKKPDHPVENILTKGFFELIKVLKSMKELSIIKRFLLSFLFYNMGMQTVLYMASLFGTEELHLKTQELIFTVLIIQLIAIFGSQFFARLSLRLGNIKTLLTGLLIWTLVCFTAYYIKTAFEYYILAGCVGFIMGGVQALSRATYSSLLPDTEDTASFFSFYSVTDKFAIILGLLVYGFINQITGNMRQSILFLIILFVIGGVQLILLQKKTSSASKLAE